MKARCHSNSYHSPKKGMLRQKLLLKHHPNSSNSPLLHRHLNMRTRCPCIYSKDTIQVVKSCILVSIRNNSCIQRRWLRCNTSSDKWDIHHNLGTCYPT